MLTCAIADLNISATLSLDEYQTDLDFVQRNVPTELDDTVLYLTGVIGKTSKQHQADGSDAIPDIALFRSRQGHRRRRPAL